MVFIEYIDTLSLNSRGLKLNNDTCTFLNTMPEYAHNYVKHIYT